MQLHINNNTTLLENRGNHARKESIQQKMPEKIQPLNNANPPRLLQLAIPPASSLHLSWSFPTCVFPLGTGTSESWLLASPQVENPTFAPTLCACTQAILHAMFPVQVHREFTSLCSVFIFFSNSQKLPR